MIRLLTIQDELTVALLVEKIIRVQPIIKSGFDWNREKIRGELETGKGIGYVEGDQLAGFILYRDLGDILEISVLGTDPERQKQGIMRQLLGTLIEQNKDKERLWLEVHENNVVARACYQCLGFCEVGMRPRYYSDKGAAILMDKKITQGISC